MSPDAAAASLDAEGIFSAVVAAAVRRARLLGLAEALAWGAAAAALSPIGGALVAVGVAIWRWNSRTRRAIVTLIERGQPDAHNLFVTADELARNELGAKTAVRARVFADVAARAQRLELPAIFPLARVAWVALLAVVAWSAAGALHVLRDRPSSTGARDAARAATPEGAPAGTHLHVDVTIQPPNYTGLGPTATVDPEQVQAIEGSVIELSIDASADGVSVEHDGRSRPLARNAGGRFTDRLQVTKTGFVAVTAADGARRTIPVVVSPDALPSVRLTAPGRDLVYAGGNPRIAFDAHATDDFGLRSLVLRYTRVTGSGENYQFLEGELPLTVKASTGRDWTGSVTRSLADLGLKDGDMIVYRAVATDARPGDGSAASDAFIIEISRLGVAAGDAFTLPEEESKYALSQQMLIVKTERLHQRRASLAQDDFAEQSLNLAVEQRMIRAEFVFMLGGEINDEEVEAEQSVELQAGRLQNRGQRDLRAATIAMSQAEKLLTGASTAEALVAERAAVTALQRAFSRDRYILRAMATRTQLDPARRLTGALGDATGWRRQGPDASANRRTALLQDLLVGLSELSTGSGDVTFSQRALLLADEAIRIDPASEPLRRAATELRRAVEAVDSLARTAALRAAAAAAATEARRAHADPTLPSQAVAPALSGAFADAMRHGR